MAVLLIGLYVALITPLRLFSFVRLSAFDSAARARLRVWGVALPFRLPKKRKKRSLSKTAALVPALLPALRLLIRGVRVRRLEVDVRAGGDAAAAALISGLLTALNGVLPRARIRSEPAFGGRGALRAQCILEARLGILWMAALVLLTAALRGRRKEV